MTLRLKQFRLLLKAIVFVGISLILASCETVGYYSQAARGQLAILLSRESISSLLNDDKIEPELKAKLSLVMEIRDFAESELLLPVADSYSSYADVGREHVVWNVFAAPEFSTNAVNWCYPIAGCVAYRGYFNEDAARSFALATEEKGFEVYTGGVDAYSTLGWFEDPLLSTVINRRDYQLAALIFHELAHQVVYIPGDTTFNESFATAVEREGLRRWLNQRGDQVSLIEAQENSIRQDQFIALVMDYQQRFETLYRGELNEVEKRRAKKQLKEDLRFDYESMKQEWNGYSGYDSWFARPLNNAQLSTVSAYNDLVTFFNGELAILQGDLAAFYARVASLKAMGKEARDTVILESFANGS
ncbi:MAG: aminopeptidase [Pseudohongiellaceae bacterium]